MSGRRYRKSKYHNRSYSKPLFDPQRLLYFSTTNQRLGKVIRPKSSAVRNNPTIKKDQVQDVFTDLNETKSFRIEGKKKGMPICLFHQHDEYESLDFDPLYESLATLSCISYPLSSLKQTEHLDQFVKNFQPFTPSLCFPIRLLQRISVDISNKQAGDEIIYQVYLIDKSQLENIRNLPSPDSLNALTPFRLYNLTISLNGAQKNQIDIEAEYQDMMYWIEHDEQENPYSVFRFKLPQAETMQVEENRVYFPATDRTFPSNNISPAMADLLENLYQQQLLNYSMWRYPPPQSEHVRVSLVRDLFEVNNAIGKIQESTNTDVFIFSYCYLNRPGASANPMPCEYMFSVEGYEINPVLSAQ